MHADADPSPDAFLVAFHDERPGRTSSAFGALPVTVDGVVHRSTYQLLADALPAAQPESLSRHPRMMQFAAIRFGDRRIRLFSAADRAAVERDCLRALQPLRDAGGKVRFDQALRFFSATAA